MDQNQPAPAVVYVPVQQQNVLKTKIPSTTTFAIAVLLFLLPFAEIKCKLDQSNKETNNNFNFGSTAVKFYNSGLGLAIGGNWKMRGLGSMLSDGADNMTSKAPPKPNVYAIVALALAVVGLIVALAGKGALHFVGIVSGVLGAAALVGLMMDLKSQLDKEGAQLGGDKLDASFALGFTPWFYICIVALLTGAFLCFKRMQLSKEKLPPPY